MQIEIVIKIDDFKDALKTLFASTPKGKQVKTEYFDFFANDGEMTLESQGFSYVCPVEVTTSGRARVPYGVIHSLRPMLAMFDEKSVTVLITSGEFKVGATSITNPEIKILVNESRKAELPIDAPLPMVLELATRFTSQELDDSGLRKRMLEATSKAESILDEVSHLLGSLGITREAIRAFVWHQIKLQFVGDKRAERSV
ncbi:MAG TPA: hypothetical protein VGV68_14815 [Terriglobia bacterium]|nr:hypothetical protein [Terriglobia bacterium]